MNKVLKTLAAVSLLASLAGCAGKSGSSAAGSASDKTIKVGATLVPHAEILKEAVAPKLEKEGWKLEVVEFSDYVLPNQSLNDGDLDAFKLAAVAGVHIEPMGFYSEKLKDIKDLQDGAKIAVPNDADNEDRGLRFLIAEGLLNDPKKDGQLVDTDFNGKSDVNPHNYEIHVMAADSLPRNLPDVDLAVINGNYALEAKLPDTNPALVVESFDKKATVARTNFIVVNEKDKDSEKTKALVKAVQSDAVKKYIEDKYKGSVIASFIDADGNAQ